MARALANHALCHVPPDRLRRRAADDRVIRAIDLIRRNVGKAYGLDDLIGELGTPKYQLIEEFREITGITPGAFMNQERIFVSCRLLHEIDLSISHIAIKVGYQDRYQFSRSFKKVCQIPPATYRQILRGEEPEWTEAG